MIYNYKLNRSYLQVREVLILNVKGIYNLQRVWNIDHCSNIFDSIRSLLSKKHLFFCLKRC